MNSIKMPVFKYLDWDTGQLGVGCALIDAGASARCGTASALGKRIKELCVRKKDAKFITIKVPGAYPETVTSLIRSGASLIGSEVIFSYSKGSAAKRLAMVSSDIKFVFCREYNSKPFISLAKEMKTSRFFKDPNISRQKALKLWEASIKNHCEGFADRLLVAICNGEPCGIITLKFKGRKQLFLHIVGVLKKYQGKQIGQRMLREITGRYSSTHAIFVETQPDNIPACSAYQKSGFGYCSLRYILHYWR